MGKGNRKGVEVDMGTQGGYANTDAAIFVCAKEKAINPPLCCQVLDLKQTGIDLSAFLPISNEESW